MTYKLVDWLHGKKGIMHTFIMEGRGKQAETVLFPPDLVTWEMRWADQDKLKQYFDDFKSRIGHETPIS